MDFTVYVKNVEIKRVKKMGDIYKIVNDINEKIYVGKAKNGAKKRWYEHIKRDIHNNQYIHNAMLLYGIEHFHYEIIESNICDEELNDREKYWIKTLKSKIPNGYNQTDGGDGGGDCKALIKWCEDHPEEAKKNRDKAREKAWEWTKDNKDEFLKYIHINQKKAVESRKKPVQCIETGVIYESASEAGRQLNLSSGSHISAVCRGQRQTAGGYHWRFSETAEMEI